LQESATIRAGSPAARAERLLAAGVLLGLLLFAFRGPLAGRVFYLRDISQNHQPMRTLVTDRLLAGELPLWDPYHGAGTPLLANPNNLVLHPISILFVLFPFDLAFTLSIVAQYLLLAWGGYLLARALPVGRPPAALAAVLLCLSGPAASMASLQNVLSAAAWVPLGLWAWLDGVRQGSRWKLALSAACAAVVLSTGEPASALAFMVLALLLGATGTGAAARRAERVRIAALLALVILGGLALAAAQILPARELLAYSAREAGFPAAEGLKWSLEPIRLLETIAPRILGDPIHLSPQAWWGQWLFEGGYPFLLTIHMGAIPCLLAGRACLRGGPDAARRRLLGAAAAFFLVIALGAHGFLYRTLFDWVPLVRQIRYPERFLLGALFAVALLAACGLEDLLAASRSPAGWRVALVICGGAAFVAATLVAASPDLADRFLAGALRVPKAVLDGDAGAVIRGGLLRSGLWLLSEIVALAALTAVPLHAVKGPRLAAWTLVGLAGVSASLAAAPALSTADRGWLDAPSPLRAAVGGGGRVHHAPRPDGLAVWTKTDEVIWGYRYDRFTYALASGRRDRIPTVLDGAADRMDLGGSARLGRELPSLGVEDRVRILSICHARFLFTHEELRNEAIETGPVLDGWSRPPLRVYRLRAPLARARFVTAATRPRHPGDLTRSLLDPDFDPERMVMLDGADGEPVGAGPDGGGASIVEDSPERIRLRVEAPRDGYLVLADAWAPGWRGRVDGAPAEILRANGLFRAVKVPAGRHAVEMTYRPASVASGFAISGVAVLAGIGWILWSRRRPL
jgi:hypothetical protein